MGVATSFRSLLHQAHLSCRWRRGYVGVCQKTELSDIVFWNETNISTVKMDWSYRVLGKINTLVMFYC